MSANSKPTWRLAVAARFQGIIADVFF